MYVFFVFLPVSYTHLDVYKRQDVAMLKMSNDYCDDQFKTIPVYQTNLRKIRLGLNTRKLMK